MQFDDDIPIPRRGGGPRLGAHPVNQMKIGQSTFIECERSANQNARFRVLARKRPGWKFVTRTVVENGVKGVRVWRVS